MLNLKTLVVGAALAMTAPAMAANVNVSFNSGASTYGSVGASYNSGSSYQNVGGGRYAFTRSGGDYAGLLDPILYTFCIEPGEWIQSYAVYDVVPLEAGNNTIGGLGVTKANAIRQLLYRNQAALSGPIALAVAEALQLAIWEIVKETAGNFNLSAGTARFLAYNNTGAVALGQSYLDALTVNGPMLANLKALARNGVQDQVIFDPTTNVPEPAMLGLLGLGFAGLVLRRRRRTA